MRLTLGVNTDAHELVVLAAMPDDQGKWTQRVIDWDKKYYGAKSGTLLDTQKVYEGRLRELANIEKLQGARVKKESGDCRRKVAG